MKRTLRRLDTIHTKLLETVSPLDDQVFAQSPSENQWSISQIVHHLCLVEERVIGELEKELVKPPRQLGFLRTLVPTSIVASRLIRVKAPKAVNPLDASGNDENISKYNAVRNRLKELYQTHGEKRIRQTVFKHPLLGEIHGLATISFVGYHELQALQTDSRSAEEARNVREILPQIFADKRGSEQKRTGGGRNFDLPSFSYPRYPRRSAANLFWAGQACRRFSRINADPNKKRAGGGRNFDLPSLSYPRYPRSSAANLLCVGQACRRFSRINAVPNKKELEAVVILIYRLCPIRVIRADPRLDFLWSFA